MDTARIVPLEPLGGFTFAGSWRFGFLLLNGN